MLIENFTTNTMCCIIDHHHELARSRETIVFVALALWNHPQTGTV